jgi:PAS domain S-box-containing protein
MFGYTSSEAVGASADLLVPLDASEPDLDVYGAARAGQSLVKETRRRRKDGGDLPVSISAAPIRDRAGRIIAVSAIYRDISVQRRREEHTRFVMRELSHRSKNLLAIVNAMARQTARGAGGIEDFESRFSERVQGLAQSHDLLVRHDWEGVAIADLVRTQLKPFLDPDDPRVVARGPALVLRPEAAQNIGMALHELATNAIKHGALSRPTGRIDIAWAIEMDASEERRLVVSWRESGGPPVEKPKQSGFGHAVLERLAVMALGGTARLDWAREGVCWRLEAPASTVAGELVRDGDAAGKDHRRLVPEIRAPDLKALYAAYVRLKAGTRETVPRLAAFESLELAGADKLFVAAVDASTEPVRFRHLTVGEALTRRLGRPLEGQALSAPAEAVIGTLEGCYRHASGVGLPCYDRARLDLGTDGSLAFERLVVPFSEDGASVTHLIGMVCFADRSVTAAGSGREEVGA